MRTVLAGSGQVTVRDADGATRTIDVDGTPRSYEVVKGASSTGTVTLTVSPGVQVYSFTFG